MTKRDRFQSLHSKQAPILHEHALNMLSGADVVYRYSDIVTALVN
ncbi:MAG TPA: hypothetical protein P5168_06180 [Candidatus Methanomethylicus sp.]|nr:hypothetical protein [Candidatus Methanomethylicus sp.]